MSATVKASIVSLIQNNESIPDKLKSHMVDTATRSNLKRSSITKSGQVVIIALDCTDAIHVDNHNRLTFFHGRARIETAVNKAFYKDVLGYYASLHAKTPKAA